jgi:uncharacterized membrane protein
MTSEAVLDMPVIMRIHVAAATLALLLGPVVLRLRGPGRLHVALGRAWVAAMAVVALSAFGISGLALIGPFGPIHLLVAWTVWTLWAGLADARAGRIATHRARFHDLYWYGLTIAGAFTLLPGRALNAALFPQAPALGLAVVAAILAGLGMRWWRRRRRQLSDKATFIWRT